MTDYAGSYNDLAFGPTTNYRITRLRWYSRDVALTNPDLPRYHGAIPGASYHVARVLEADFRVEGATRAEVIDNLDSFYAAFEPQVDDDLPFVFGLPSQTDRRLLCRPANLNDPGLTADNLTAKSVLIPVRMVATDPAFYGNTLETVTLTPFTSAAGLSWNIVWPAAWGAGGAGGGSTLTLGGKWETWPVFKINGPSSGTMTNPRIEGVTAGKELNLNANGGASLTAGQQIVIDTHPARRSVAFATGASRYGKLSTASEFFPLQPGANELRFRANGTTTHATVEVEARPAWI